MTHKLNCWEFKNCGREPGGVLANQLGICPVAVLMKHDGDNGGRAAGRVCWNVPVAEDHGPMLKSCADKACMLCSFYKRVQFEEQTPKKGHRSLTLVGKQTRTTKPETEPTEVA